MNDWGDFALNILKRIIQIPSFSREEDKTATYLFEVLKERNIKVYRTLNNVWAIPDQYDISKPSIILNSHHDTVKPNSNYTHDPFHPIIENDKIYGLGSNDAGGSLVSMLAVFLHFNDEPHPIYNIIWTATAEEEISGVNGIQLLLNDTLFNNIIPAENILGCIVGEPTEMKMAIAERGLMVIDATIIGETGHVANHEGSNSIYLAMEDIQTIKKLSFEKISPFLGPVKCTVSSINTENKQHNVVPSTCSYIIDIRINELYTHEEILNRLQQILHADITARSMRIKSSIIPLEHPLVTSGKSIGIPYYGSPTTSDKALIPFPTLKMGPGLSQRSHSANEFIYISEIYNGIDIYITLLKNLS